MSTDLHTALYNSNAMKKVYMKNGSFFSFLMDKGFPEIIDFIHINRGIAISKDNSLEICGEKEKLVINSINALREICEGLFRMQQT